MTKTYKIFPPSKVLLPFYLRPLNSFFTTAILTLRKFLPVLGNPNVKRGILYFFSFPVPTLFGSVSACFGRITTQGGTVLKFCSSPLSKLRSSPQKNLSTERTHSFLPSNNLRLEETPSPAVFISFISRLKGFLTKFTILTVHGVSVAYWNCNNNYYRDQ